jgi:glycerol-3-phosphate dehydrogenase
VQRGVESSPFAIDRVRFARVAARKWPWSVLQWSRVGRVQDLDGAALDVLVVGGGIIGCGIARDAALRGFRVALIEKADFGSGTTSASTRIVHGGLRYLERLDVRLVRLDLRERETLLRIAPHLVKPLEFLIPFYGPRRATAMKLRAGLALYDALSFDKSLPSRRWLTSAEARAADPSLDRPDVTGAAAYHDARVDSPERLALENVLDAELCGGRALNYCEAVAVTQSGDSRSSLTVRVRGVLDANEATLRAAVVVNATGAWADPVATRLMDRRAAAVRTTKGIHLVCRPLTGRALVLFSEVDRRLMFAIPRAGLTWIGTTDTDYSGDPSAARATRTDIDYLLQSVRHAFPGLRREDVLFTTAGVRALVRSGGSESAVSRMHRIVDGEPLGPRGTVTVLGGKITGYRAIAEEVTDLISRRLGSAGPCVTADRALPGAMLPVAQDGLRSPADERLWSHLRDLYGARAANVLALAESMPAWRQPLSPAYPDIGAQVIYSVRFEHCLRIDDFIRRRTLLGATADQGVQAVDATAALMAEELSWPAALRTAEAASALRPPGSDLEFPD